ncbi:DUF4433 domain-containing protein [Promicromonospora sukumoe]|uniref:DarT domain-containing protein n=1 Tax=Promicromonospora sukumoe TaxID=88382 RepID=A0A7W3PG12_9MICO|nr:DarT ssDNA thymidine ADP-ribosyltransferase family protein [Promicromonospora sukumoe]MBA8810311.1 hypothetical protein [Promicromonospora sukumoe]
MTVDAWVADALAVRGVTRLAHVTPARNLPNILIDQAIRSVKDMGDDARAIYAANDLQRLDNHPDKVSCSLEYPNVFYLNKVRHRPDAHNFPDWVCILLDRDVAATPDALFCPRNAGAYGASKEAGVAGLDACYTEAVSGSYGKTYSRGTNHDPRCPTDVQAEILVPAPIPLTSAYGIVFPSEQAASNEFVRLEQLSVAIPNHLQWIVSPGLFDAASVTNAVRMSRGILEQPWVGEGRGSW